MVPYDASDHFEQIFLLYFDAGGRSLLIGDRLENCWLATSNSCIKKYYYIFNFWVRAYSKLLYILLGKNFFIVKSGSAVHSSLSGNSAMQLIMLMKTCKFLIGDSCSPFFNF